MSTVTKPLYKVLNEKRTQCNWILDADTIGTGTEPTDETIADFKPEMDELMVWQRDFNEMKAKQKYAALAVNNLSILAEALQGMVDEFDSYAVPASKYPQVKATIEKAKEALNKIS